MGLPRPSRTPGAAAGDARSRSGTGTAGAAPKRVPRLRPPDTAWASPRRDLSANAHGGPPATRRSLELAPLAFTTVLATSVLVLVQANQEGRISTALVWLGLVWLGLVWLGLAYLGLFSMARLIVRRLAPYPDPLVLGCAAPLNRLGLVVMHRVDLARADRAAQRVSAPPELCAGRRLGSTAIALGLFLATPRWMRKHRALARSGYPAGPADGSSLVANDLKVAPLPRISNAARALASMRPTASSPALAGTRSEMVQQ